VTFPPERVMSALAPITEGAPPIQPRADTSSGFSSSMSSSASYSSGIQGEDSAKRAKRALFGAG
jgi:hypothetical protein